MTRFRALSGRLKFTVRRHKFNKYSLFLVRRQSSDPDFLVRTLVSLPGTTAPGKEGDLEKQRRVQEDIEEIGLDKVPTGPNPRYHRGD